MLAGRVDGAINDNGPLLDYAKDNPTTEVVKEFDTGEQYGLMFKKDDANGTKMAEKANEILKAAKADGRYNDDLQEVVRGRRPEVILPSTPRAAVRFDRTAALRRLWSQHP